MTTVPRHFVDDLRRTAFAPGRARRVGAEVELIPVDGETRRLAWIEPPPGSDERATLPVLRRLGSSLGWREERSAKAGVPEFRTPGGGRITFEPGGQVEFSAPPAVSVQALVASLGSVVDPLRAALADEGIDTLAVGLDPANAIAAVPLQLTAVRYTRMARHFATLGEHGARMMRQSASIQVCLDAGEAPVERWRLLNALAPYLAAIFANSPLAEGEATGWQSTRRRVWRFVDPSRTGLFGLDADPVEAYARFASGAAAILMGSDAPPFPAFGEWSARGATLGDWRAHLTTLFPEVRPRGYFEVRSCDAVAPEWYAAPIAFVTALAYGPDRGRSALAIAGEPSAAVLDLAGRAGLDDARLADRAVQLADLSLREAESLGDGVIDGGARERLRDFFDRFTRRRRAPASEQVALAGA